MPWLRATPKAPPNTAWGRKAWLNTAPKNQGMRVKLPRMRATTVAT